MRTVGGPYNKIHIWPILGHIGLSAHNCVKTSTFYLTPNGTHLYLKPLVSLIIGDANQAFLSQAGEDLSKDTAMAIMDELNCTANTSTEGVEEAAYVGKIPTAGMEVIDELTGGDPGSPDKRLKTFVPPGIETISYPVISKFIYKIQVNMNHSADIIVGAHDIISLLNSNIGYVPEYHTKIWCDMGYIMIKLISHGEVLENLDLELLMKEAKEAHILTANIKILWMMLCHRQR